MNIRVIGMIVFTYLFLQAWAVIRGAVIYTPYKISDREVVECAEYLRQGDMVWLADCKLGKQFNRIPYTEVVEFKQ
jgi:hypothetical protein